LQDPLEAQQLTDPLSDALDQGPPVQMEEGEETEGDDEPKSGANDYTGALKKVGETFLKTETGKKLVEEVKNFALGDGAPITAMVGVQALVTMVAQEWDVPSFLFDLIPEIELGDKVSMKITPIWKGPLTRKPDEWGGTVTLDLSKVVWGSGPETAPEPGKVAKDRTKFWFTGRVLDDKASPFAESCTAHIVDTSNKSVAMTNVYDGNFKIGFWANPGDEAQNKYKVVVVPRGFTAFDKASTDVDLSKVYRPKVDKQVVKLMFMLTRKYTDGTTTMHMDYPVAPL